MDIELKEKLLAMSEEELREILNNENQYMIEVVQLAKQLLNEDNTNENNINTDIPVRKDRLVKKQFANKQLYIIVMCVVIAVLFFASIFGTFYYNNMKQEKQTAINRINSICDEINNLETDIEVGKLSIYDSKVSEMETLIEEYKIDEMYREKYTVAKNYVSDLRVYDKITKAFLSVDMESWGSIDNDEVLWTNIQTNINRLKTQRVRGKIDRYQIERIRKAAEDWIIFNSLKHFEEAIIRREKFNVTDAGITGSYCFDISSDIDKDYIRELPDSYILDNISSTSFGIITDNNPKFLDIYWYGMECGYVPLGSKAVKEAIFENANKIFVVKYVDNELNDKYSYVVKDFSVKANYENGYLKIVLNDEEGEEKIDFNKLKNKKILEIF